MRRVIWVALVLAVIWGGWWIWAAQAARQATEQWFADRRAEGWQADFGGLDISGFPLRFDAVMTLPALADPETGVAVTTSGVTFSAPAWWPGDVTVRLPQDPVTFASPESRATLDMDQAVARLRLKPGSALDLEAAQITSGAWSLSAPMGDVLSAADLNVSVQQVAAGQASYTVALSAAGLQPGTVPRTALRVPTNWPLTFDKFALDMQVAFDRVWDRRAIEVARPQPRSLRIDLAEAAWGELQLRAAADLTIDAQGTPEGTLSLQARNWREMLTLAEAAGVLPSAVRPQAESVLSALAQATGDPRSINVDLTLRNGLILLGFVPLGQAPQLVLR
ncbi:DUF2125 domain-containing protein [uncultured Roseobacter sp.]|uniref:DUF2125 domain-containing protein n=1 Tax=uncultured Roseobacter sp. TaxID=114847 RepID=UPI0026118274|nr:DUF2125 domain-containing protein [uncultured Roseobacter sp.]